MLQLRSIKLLNMHQDYFTCRNIWCKTIKFEIRILYGFYMEQSNSCVCLSHANYSERIVRKLWKAMNIVKYHLCGKLYYVVWIEILITISHQRLVKNTVLNPIFKVLYKINLYARWNIIWLSGGRELSQIFERWLMDWWFHQIDRWILSKFLNKVCHFD